MQHDPVNRPAHYIGANGLEAIEVIEKWGLGFHLGNAMKYVLRAGKKGEAAQDLKKAKWYVVRARSEVLARRKPMSNVVAADAPTVPAVLAAFNLNIHFPLGQVVARLAVISTSTSAKEVDTELASIAAMLDKALRVRAASPLPARALVSGVQ